MESLHQFDIDVEKRIIYMNGGVDDDMMQKLTKNLLILGDGELFETKIVLNSPGGDAVIGLRIHEIISNLKAHVRIFALQADSAASLILQAGDDRIMLSSAHLLIHIGEIKLAEGHPENVQKTKTYFDEIDKKINKIYLSRIREKKKRFTEQNFKEQSKFDWYVSSKTAIEFNLVDRIGVLNDI